MDISTFFTWFDIVMFALWLIFHLSAALGRGRDASTIGKLIGAGFTCLAVTIILTWLLWMNSGNRFFTWLDIAMLVLGLIFLLSAAWGRGRDSGTTGNLIGVGFTYLAAAAFLYWLLWTNNAIRF